MMLRKYNIRSRQVTTKNPQANAVCERMHQSMANQIRAVYNNNPPGTSDEARVLVDSLLANVMYALRVGVHSVLNMAPGSIAFHRDMIMNLPFVVDLKNIKERRQCLVDKNNDREMPNALIIIITLENGFLYVKTRTKYLINLKKDTWDLIKWSRFM